MKKILLSFLFTVMIYPSFGQDLTATIFLLQEPWCRTAGFQSGNGVLLAGSSGGVGSLSYQWSSQAFVDINNLPFPTVVIKSPGKYYLQVTDEENNIALDSIIVDSINPEANFEFVTNDFYTSNPYEAYDKAEVNINNLDASFFFDPLCEDTVYFWTIKNNINQVKNYYTSRPEQSIDTVFNNVGVHEVCLITRNFNNCRDTLCKEISIVSSLILDPEMPVAVFPDYNSQTIQFHSKDFTENHIVNIYSIDGKLLRSVNLNAPIQTVKFAQAKGVYVYSVVLADKSESAGKFVFSL